MQVSKRYLQYGWIFKNICHFVIKQKNRYYKSLRIFVNSSDKALTSFLDSQSASDDAPITELYFLSLHNRQNSLVGVLACFAIDFTRYSLNGAMCLSTVTFLKGSLATHCSWAVALFFLFEKPSFFSPLTTSPVTSQ